MITFRGISRRICKIWSHNKAAASQALDDGAASMDSNTRPPDYDCEVFDDLEWYVRIVDPLITIF